MNMMIQQSPPQSPSLTEQLAGWFAALRYEDLADDVVKNTRLRILELPRLEPRRQPTRIWSDRPSGARHRRAARGAYHRLWRPYRRTVCRNGQRPDGALPRVRRYA